MEKIVIEYQEIKNERGTKRGLYTYPLYEKKGLVVMFHGYTGHKNENGFLFKTLSLELAECGFASLRFDFLGSGDSDGEFRDITFDSEVMDAEDIIRRAKELNNNLPIILLGFSFGGAIAGYLSYKYMDDIEKLVLLSPAGNMNLIAENTFKCNAINSDGDVDLGGYLLNRRFLESFNGINLYENVDKFIKPVLLIHGEGDCSVPVEYGRKYHSLFPHNLMVEISGAPHCYTKVEYRKELNENVINFLKKY